MPLTEDVNVATRARLKSDPELCREILREAFEVLLAGEPGVAKALLRNYVLARIGFEDLGRKTGKTPESLMRMLSPRGNPHASNLADILKVVQAHEGVAAEVRIKPAKKVA